MYDAADAAAEPRARREDGSTAANAGGLMGNVERLEFF